MKAPIKPVLPLPQGPTIAELIDMGVLSPPPERTRSGWLCDACFTVNAPAKDACAHCGAGYDGRHPIDDRAGIEGPE